MSKLRRCKLWIGWFRPRGAVFVSSGEQQSQACFWRSRACKHYTYLRLTCNANTTPYTDVTAAPRRLLPANALSPRLVWIWTDVLRTETGCILTYTAAFVQLNAPCAVPPATASITCGCHLVIDLVVYNMYKLQTAATLFDSWGRESKGIGNV